MGTLDLSNGGQARITEIPIRELAKHARDLTAWLGLVPRQVPYSRDGACTNWADDASDVGGLDGVAGEIESDLLRSFPKSGGGLEGQHDALDLDDRRDVGLPFGARYGGIGIEDADETDLVTVASFGIDSANAGKQRDLDGLVHRLADGWRAHQIDPMTQVQTGISHCPLSFMVGVMSCLRRCRISRGWAVGASPSQFTLWQLSQIGALAHALIGVMGHTTPLHS